MCNSIGQFFLPTNVAIFVSENVGEFRVLVAKTTYMFLLSKKDFAAKNKKALSENRLITSQTVKMYIHLITIKDYMTILDTPSHNEHKVKK